MPFSNTPNCQTQINHETLTDASEGRGSVILYETEAGSQLTFNACQRRLLTWLPSFCQKTAGGGFPLVPQRKVTVRPGAVIWSRGRTTICGGTATRRVQGNGYQGAIEITYLCVIVCVCVCGQSVLSGLNTVRKCRVCHRK